MRRKADELLGKLRAEREECEEQERRWRELGKKVVERFHNQSV
jgi:hypothetical protein